MRATIQCGHSAVASFYHDWETTDSSAMRQFVLDYLAQQCGKANQIASYRRETDEADLLITLDRRQADWHLRD